MACFPILLYGFVNILTPLTHSSDFFFLLFAVILFCMAALIFPIGFYINEVGGQPYKLPNNTVVGSSYVLFVLSIFFTIVGLLFAGKVCLPGWRMSGLRDFILEKRHRTAFSGGCLDMTIKHLLKKECFDLFSLCTLDWKKDSLSHNQIQTTLTNLLSIFNAVRSALW